MDGVIDLLSSSSDSESASNASNASNASSHENGKPSTISVLETKPRQNQGHKHDFENENEFGIPSILPPSKSGPRKSTSIAERRKREKDYDSDSFIEIGDRSESDGDDFNIQVPDSSPQRKRSSKVSSELDSSPPAKITTKLPSLREKFAFKEENSLKPQPSDFKTDYLELKRVFPKLPASTIISALKSQKTLRNSIHYLKSISSDDFKPSQKPIKSATSHRLDSLSSKSGKLILSSSPTRSVSRSGLGAFDKEKQARFERDRRLREKAKAIEEKKRKHIQREQELARKKAKEEDIISSKVLLNKTSKSIKDRYVSRQARLKNADYEENLLDNENEEENDSEVELVDSEESLEEIIVPPARKRSKRGYENDDDYSPKKQNTSVKPKKTKIARANRAEKRSIVIEDDDFALPEFEVDADADLNVDEKIVKLFNNAEIRDIIDLSNMKPEQATIVVKSRPYRTLNDIYTLDLTPDKKTSRAHKKPIERFVDTISQKLLAYSAIDTLLKQCFDYSRSITKEIKKWGVNLKGENMTGELSITNVEVSGDENGDELSNENNSSSDDDTDEPILKRSVFKKKFKIDGSENDDDYNFSGRKKIYRSGINNSIVKDRICYFKKKPELLSDGISLKDYQQVGINWINLLFQKQLSCILADEMGLGKTAQVIAFLSHLKQKRYLGPHLIVVPSSTLENWLREFEKFSPSLKVIPYYGSLDEREELRSVLVEDEYDVVVTTYNLTTGKIDAPFLQMLDFNVIVYDEGHMLKNATSDRYKKLTRLKANFRLLLTGTPLQNNLRELISLLDFILPEIFDSKLSKLELLFDQKATTKTENHKIEGEAYNPLMSEQAINKAKVMMSPFILRRTKAQVMKDLPQKHTSIEYCVLTPSQKRIYNEELKSIDDVRQEKARRKALNEKELKNLPPLINRGSNLLMMLRKACMHPLLFRRNYTDLMLRVMSRLIMKNPAYADANQQYIFEDFQVMTDFEIAQFCHNYPNELGKFVLKQKIYEDSGKVKVLVDMLTKIIERGEKVLVFSLFTQMLDILEKVLSLHNWKFLRLDGATAVETRQSIIDKFYEDKTIPVMLLSTKAGGFGINLVCATNVIIFDQSLNPHDDKQAEDRAHRVGQTEEVYVTRLITKGSIEENILHLAFNKLQLDNSMMAQKVEDILLKTVEDILASKEEATIEEVKVKENKEKAGETVQQTGSFDAFETPLSLELVADTNKQVKDELIVIDAPEEKKEILNGNTKNRRRRTRQRVNYYDGNSIPIDVSASDDEDSEDKKELKKDQSFQPDDSGFSDKTTEPKTENIVQNFYKPLKQKIEVVGNTSNYVKIEPEVLAALAQGSKPIMQNNRSTNNDENSLHHYPKLESRNKLVNLTSTNQNDLPILPNEQQSVVASDANGTILSAATSIEKNMTGGIFKKTGKSENSCGNSDG